MKIISLKRSKREKEQMNRPATVAGGDDYGYGNQMTLSHEHLERMGVDDLPSAGEEFEIHGRAKVHRSEERTVNGKPQRELGIQVTHLGIKPKTHSIRDDITSAVEKK